MRIAQRLVIATFSLVWLGGCGQSTDTTATEEPTVRPNLPTVPTVPPPPHPITYPDGTYTVYGLRKRIERTIDSEVKVTGYISWVYAAPECPEGRTCPPPKMPHLRIADTPNETDERKTLVLVGYAANQKEIDDAREELAHGRTPAPPEGEGLPPIPTDLEIGRRGVFEGRFTRVAGSGFLESEGLLDYRRHLLEGTPEPTKTR
jgi:hypothetical protein